MTPSTKQGMLLFVFLGDSLERGQKAKAYASESNGYTVRLNATLKDENFEIYS
jgi:hypothetical protein